MQATSDKAVQSGPFGRQDPSLPQVFGRYLLIQRLSRGGMGEIFLAKHGLAGFEKLAVIKKVLPHLAADAQFISRFVDEAQVAIKLQHVNVAQVFEVGRVGDEYFLALEYVEGRDLRRTLSLLGHRKQRLPVDLALFVGRELANGLAYAHRRTSADGASLNLVHCDVSPPNVLVSFEGETKVIDFGIAKSALRGTATDPKMGFGKFGYMAPEQLIRGGVVDHRTDIYAAGVVLFELVTGQRLYEAGPEPDYRALAKKVSRGEHPLPSEIDPMLAPYDDLVATALRPKVEDRYQSAAEFRDAIQQALVAVNPTISTDQLGLYMRELFAEEMTAQRELHERVAKTHLSDFQDHFHTQTISTVSFALAQLPLQPGPPELPLGPGRGKKSAQQPAIRPSPALDTMAPPTATMVPPTEELSLADGTGTSVREQPQGSTRRWVWALVAAIAVGVAVVVFATTRAEPKGAVTTATSAGAATPPPVNNTITVEPIETPDEPRVATAAAAEIQMKAEPTGSAKPAVVIRKPRDKDRRDRTRRDHARRDPDREAVAKADKRDSKKTDGPSRDFVTNAWLAAQREYRGYKSRNGTQLESEYTDLMMFVTYKLKGEASLGDALKKIQTFRQKIRE